MLETFRVAGDRTPITSTAIELQSFKSDFESSSSLTFSKVQSQQGSDEESKTQKGEGISLRSDRQ